MTEQTFKGPCVVCGRTDYQLSYGGPTICPACDCGNYDPQMLLRQLKHEREAVAASENRVKELEAALRGMLAHVREMDEAGQEHCACSRCQSASKLLEAPHEP